MAKIAGVYKYPTNGGVRWRYQFEHGRRYGQRGFLTQREAADAMATKRSEVGQGIGVGPSRLFGDFAERTWLASRRAAAARGELRQITVDGDAADLRNHILPAWAKRPIRDMTDFEAIERWRDGLTAQGLAADTVRGLVHKLGQVLDDACRCRLIPFNPVHEVRKPPARRRTPVLPTPEEVDRLADVMPTAETRALVLFASQTGFRKGECFALRWENVSLERGDERAWVVEHVHKGVLVPSAKTRAGSREVLLGPRLAAVLRELSVGQQLDGRPNPLGLVFPSPTGRHWLDTNFDRRVWKRARGEAGLRGLMFHTLRYFYVSHVRAQGLASALTEQMVGHVDERTHVGYTRPIPGTEPIIRAALVGAFGEA